MKMTEITITREALIEAGKLGGDLAMASIISYLQQWPEGFWSQNVVENVAAFWDEPLVGVREQMRKLIEAGAVLKRTSEANGKPEYQLS